MPPPSQSEQTLTRWMIPGFVCSLLISTVGLVVLVLGFGVPVRLGIQPATVLLLCLVIYYLMMFFERRHFQRSRDLRLGILVTGLFYLVTGELGMRYGVRLGLVQPESVSSNSLRFGIYIAVITLIPILLLSFLKPK